MEKEDSNSKDSLSKTEELQTLSQNMSPWPHNGLSAYQDNPKILAKDHHAKRRLLLQQQMSPWFWLLEHPKII